MLKYPTEDRFFSLAPSSSSTEELESAFTPLSAPLKLGRVADWTGQLDGHYHHGSANANASHSHGASGKRNSVDGWHVKRVVPVTAAASSASTKKKLQPLNSNSPVLSTSSTASNRVKRLTREPSCPVQTGWKLIEEIEMNRLSKLLTLPEQEAVVVSPGSLPRYDRQYDRLTVKQEKRLPNATAVTASPFVEPNISSIQCSVEAAALLMACDRTVMPWHLDLHVDGQGGLSLTGNAPHWIGEGSVDPISDDCMQALAKEAASVQASLYRLIASADQCTPRVLEWQLSSTMRVQVHGQEGIFDPDCLIRPLVETEPKVGLEWRKRLDQQRGAVLASELRLNYALLARWIYQATLLDSPSIRLAFCSRLMARDPSAHSLLCIIPLEPEELATQMNLNIEHGWGILRTLLERFLALPAGRYTLMRDPNKALLRIYQLPK